MKHNFLEEMEREMTIDNEFDKMKLQILRINNTKCNIEKEILFNEVFKNIDEINEIIKIILDYSKENDEFRRYLTNRMGEEIEA